MGSSVVGWLLGAPQFWLGAARAALDLLAAARSVLRPRKTVEGYRISERAPAPPRDPFYKAGPVVRPVAPQPTATRARSTSPYRTGRIPAPRRNAMGEARKRAVWHPHPDDDLPPWRLLS